MKFPADTQANTVTPGVARSEGLCCHTTSCGEACRQSEYLHRLQQEVEGGCSTLPDLGMS